jgi:hypothetical protein
VFGQVGVPEKPCGGTVTVHHHLEGYPATQWPVSEGYFKALVRLDPGPNKLRFEYNSSKTPSFSTSLTVNMLPLAASPPLHLAVLLGKDSAGRFDCQGERQEHEGNGTEMAQKKLRMAAHLVQVRLSVLHTGYLVTPVTGFHSGTDVQKQTWPQVLPIGRGMGC